MVGVTIQQIMESQNEGESGRPVQAVDTSCRIIDALRELNGAGVTSLADHLNISKATAHNHLATLRQHEWVTKNSGTYNVSLRFIEMGEHTKNQIPVYDLVSEEIEELAEKTGEVTSFMVEEHGKGVYIHKAEGEDAVQTYSRIGDRKHLHCSALGKAILSQLPTDRVGQIVDQFGLPQHTDQTITDEDDLLEEIEHSAERGYAIDDEEVIAGLRCVAAPVIGHDQTVYGAISVSGPISRMKGEYLHEELPEIILETTTIIKINSTQL